MGATSSPLRAHPQEFDIASIVRRRSETNLNALSWGTMTTIDFKVLTRAWLAAASTTPASGVKEFLHDENGDHHV